MPWHIVEDHPHCSTSKPWGVVKNADGSVAGCHPTKAAAQKQMAALYANEGSMNSASDDGMLERSVHFTLLERAEGDGMTLEGYAAVFNSPTRIDSWEGTFDEVIAPGAFAHTIRNGSPVLMFEHGKHPLYGSMPIGAIQRLKEDARGLFVSARLFDNWMNQPLRDAIASQAIDGMSFRFSVPDGKDEMDYSGDLPLRTIHEVKLYELGPVVFPAYADTTVALRCLDEVRNMIGSPEQPADEAVATDPPSDDPTDGQSSPTQRTEWWTKRSAAFVDDYNRRKGT